VKNSHSMANSTAMVEIAAWDGVIEYERAEPISVGGAA